VATSVRPTADGRGWLIALYNPAAEAHEVRIAWRGGERVRIRLSDSAEGGGASLAGPVALAAHATAIVRVDP
jgi:hypothetical protein